MNFRDDENNKGNLIEGEDSFSSVSFFEEKPQKERPIRPKRNPKLRKKQIRNIFIAGFVTGAIITTIVGVLIPDKKGPSVTNEIPIETPVETAVETAVEPVLIPEELMSGRNHSNAAKDYAYDIKEVKDWIGGGKSDGKKTVFLTFDDGPSTYTREVLDVLKEKEVPATFFLLGEKAEKVSATNDIWKRYIEEGHGIAIHSYSHKYEILYKDKTPNMEAVIEEWDTTTDILKERVGEGFNTRVFRFPGGSMSWQGMDEARVKLEDRDIFDVDWTAMTGDSEPTATKPKTVDEAWSLIQDNITRTAHPETMILLMHDAKADTPKFLGEIIEKLKAEGYEFGIMY